MIIVKRINTFFKKTGHNTWTLVLISHYSHYSTSLTSGREVPTGFLSDSLRYSGGSITDLQESKRASWNTTHSPRCTFLHRHSQGFVTVKGVLVSLFFSRAAKIQWLLFWRRGRVLSCHICKMWVMFNFISRRLGSSYLSTLFHKNDSKHPNKSRK